MDTPAKRGLWYYLLPVIETEHEDIAHKFFSKNRIDIYRDFNLDKRSSTPSLRNSRAFKTNSMNNIYDEIHDYDDDINYYEDIDDRPDHRITRRSVHSEYSPDLKRSKKFNSTPSLANLSLVDDNELVMKFIKQV